MWFRTGTNVTVMNRVLTLEVSESVGNFFTSWWPVSFSKRTLPHGLGRVFINFFVHRTLLISKNADRIHTKTEGSIKICLNLPDFRITIPCKLVVSMSPSQGMYRGNRSHFTCSVTLYCLKSGNWLLACMLVLLCLFPPFKETSHLQGKPK